MPDDFNAEMHIHVTSAPSEDPAQWADQQARSEQLVNEIAARYDWVVFEEGNVHFHQEESIVVGGRNLEVSTVPVSVMFSHEELEEMRRAMETDPTAVQYFK